MILGNCRRVRRCAVTLPLGSSLLLRLDLDERELTLERLVDHEPRRIHIGQRQPLGAVLVLGKPLVTGTTPREILGVVERSFGGVQVEQSPGARLLDAVDADLTHGADRAVEELHSLFGDSIRRLADVEQRFVRQLR